MFRYEFLYTCFFDVYISLCLLFLSFILPYSFMVKFWICMHSYADINVCYMDIDSYVKIWYKKHMQIVDMTNNLSSKEETNNIGTCAAWSIDVGVLLFFWYLLNITFLLLHISQRTSGFFSGLLLMFYFFKILMVSGLHQLLLCCFAASKKPGDHLW